MSQYGWEYGSLVIPKSQWAGVKKTIRNGVAAAIEHDKEVIREAYEKVKLANKGKRGVFWDEQVEQACHTISYNAWGSASKSRLKYFRPDEVCDMLIKNGKFQAPKASEYPKITSKITCFKTGDLTVTFRDDMYTLYWDVEKNNHAVRDARNSALGMITLNALDAIKWTRETGGAFYGNDEDNEEDRADHGGSNYITQRFGPVGKGR